MQLNLFTDHILCVHCKKNPGTGNNPVLWNGFRDAETREYVCSHCRKKHYRKKLKTSSTGGIIIQEMPVMAIKKVKWPSFKKIMD